MPQAFVFRVSLWFQVAFTGLVLGYPAASLAQTLQVKITVKTPSAAKVQVELEAPGDVDGLSFRDSYGSVLGLAQRIKNVEAIDGDGETISVLKSASGQFKCARKARRFNYEVDLSPPSRLEDVSHVSWLTERRGLLMPADLLPRFGNATAVFSDVRFSFVVPHGWTVHSGFERTAKQEFVTGEPDEAVFLVGIDLRESVKRYGATSFKLTTSGEWPFSNDDLLKTAQKIIQEYAEVTGFELKQNPTVLLIPFPASVGRERWTAETRGNTVVLLLGSEGKQKALLNRIGILLSHELFHLWVPNSLKLEGDYDWFFEGFTLYQALLTAERLGLISFNDYLETMGRVYRSYVANPNRNRLSLIEASATRWTGAGTLVYDKGMLLAFVYDLALRSKSNCTTSLTDVYRELFRLQSTGQENANETIIQILNRIEGSGVFTKNYVHGREELRVESIVPDYGLNVRTTGSAVELSVRSDLTDDKRRLLKCLGY